MEPKQTEDYALGGVVRGTGALAAAGLTAAAGWALYSAFFVDHRRNLPFAIPANRYVTSTPRSGRLSYYADETGSGRPIVLLHSINAAASSREMRPLFDYFRGERPVFALDLPGFGFSERGSRDYTPDLYVHAIHDLAHGELSVNGGVDVVALSLSCEFAAMAAAEIPSAYHSLTFIGPTGFGEEKRGETRWLSKALESTPIGQALYDLLVTRASIDYFLQKAFCGAVDESLADYDYLTAHQPGARHAPLQFISGRLFTPAIMDVYTELRQPVLAFCSQSDYGASTLLPDFVVSHPNWKTICLEGMKAMPHFERPAETMREIESFLGSPKLQSELA